MYSPEHTDPRPPSPEEERNLELMEEMEDHLSLSLHKSEPDRRVGMARLSEFLETSGLPREEMDRAIVHHFGISIGNGMRLDTFDSVVDEYGQYGIVISNEMLSRIGAAAIDYISKFGGRNSVEEIRKHFSIEG